MSLLLQCFPELKDTQELATGSTAYEVATKPIKRVMDAATGFLSRFRLRGSAPQHRSGTSALWFAEDVSNEDEAPVALKFMRNHAALEASASHTDSTAADFACVHRLRLTCARGCHLRTGTL